MITSFIHDLADKHIPSKIILKKVREKSRECHSHKPQPFPDPKRKSKPTNLNKHKPNKRTKSTKISSLFPKRGKSVSTIPWITPEIRRKIRKRYKFHAKAKKTGSGKPRAKFESLRREIKADIKKHHDLYVNNC